MPAKEIPCAFCGKTKSQSGAKTMIAGADASKPICAKCIDRARTLAKADGSYKKAKVIDIKTGTILD